MACFDDGKTEAQGGSLIEVTHKAGSDCQDWNWELIFFPEEKSSLKEVASSQLCIDTISYCLLGVLVWTLVLSFWGWTVVAQRLLFCYCWVMCWSHWLRMKALAVFSVDEDTVHLELSYFAGESTNWHTGCGKVFGSFYKTKKFSRHINQEFYL